MINYFEILNITKVYYYDDDERPGLTLNESVEVYNCDGSFNRLKIEDNDYEDLSIYDAQQKAKNNIKKQRGNKYKNIETSNNIYIDKKTMNEFTYSKYSSMAENKIKYVKCILSVYIEELFLNANNKTYEANRKSKHKIDAKYGFYEYNVKFSVLQNKKEVMYNCTLLVRNDANGKKYLYDILDIKKFSQLPREP